MEFTESPLLSSDQGIDIIMKREKIGRDVHGFPFTLLRSGC